jgi:VWFA-related protein
MKVLPRGTELPALPPGFFDERKAFDTASRWVADLARTSGGRVERASTPEEIALALARIADEVRRQYVLYYYPANTARDGAFHTIRVESSRPGVTMRTRTGYRAR